MSVDALAGNHSTAASINAPSAPGWQAELELRLAARGERTVLVHTRHRGPLLVQRPFYPEAGVCHVYIIHPPGGVVGGDQLRITAEVQSGARALLTTPAAGRFYRSVDGREARQDVVIDVRDAEIEWLPQETIFYRGACARIRTALRLSEASRFIGWDIACVGLPARRERYSAGKLRLGFEVSVDDRSLLHDRLLVDGAADGLSARWGWAGLPVLGTMLAYPIERAMLADLRSLPDAGVEEGLVALSCVDGLLVCRALGLHADRVRQCFVAIWRWLRPRLLSRAAVAPRIWAT